LSMPFGLIRFVELILGHSNMGLIYTSVCQREVA
jgi:hypothetical protein